MQICCIGRRCVEKSILSKILLLVLVTEPVVISWSSWSIVLFQYCLWSSWGCIRTMYALMLPDVLEYYTIYMAVIFVPPNDYGHSVLLRDVLQAGPGIALVDLHIVGQDLVMHQGGLELKQASRTATCNAFI